MPLPEGRKKYTKTMPMQVEDMDACKKWFLAETRAANDTAWKIDFKSLYASALAQARPHWQASKAAADRAKALDRQVKQAQAAIRANHPNAEKKTALEKRLKQLSTAATRERRIQAEEQTAGDAAYWPVFNLDHKNPNSVDALEYRPPDELVAGIIDKEREILRLMTEIETEVKALV